MHAALCSFWEGSSSVSALPGLCKLNKPAPGPSHTPWAVLHLLTHDMDFRLSSTGREMPASDTWRANSAPPKKFTWTIAVWENILSILKNCNSFRYFMFWCQNLGKTYIISQGIGRERPPKSTKECLIRYHRFAVLVLLCLSKLQFSCLAKELCVFMQIHWEVQSDRLSLSTVFLSLDLVRDQGYQHFD